MITFENIYKSFGHNHVLRGVNLKVERGESMVIIGGSGTGKSVLIKCIIGLLKVDSGSIIVFDKNISEMNVESMKQTLSNNLQNVIETYQVRSQLASISQENLVYAKKAFELAEKRFELGSMNSIDLTSFQNAYQNTMIQHYQNLYNKLDTYLEVYKMTGKISLEYSK